MILSTLYVNQRVCKLRSNMVQQSETEQLQGIRTEKADQSMRSFTRKDIESLASLSSDVRWIKWVLGIFATLTIGGGVVAFFYILQRFDSLDIILLEIIQKLPS